MKKNTYENLVLDHLKKRGSISTKEAFDLYGITTLRNVIYYFRKKGYDIETDMNDSVNRYGSFVSYGVYSLKDKTNE